MWRSRILSRAFNLQSGINSVPVVPGKYAEDVRSEEGICIKFADHKVETKEYQVIIHPNPLLDVLNERC